MEGLRKEPDLAAVITGTALVEATLENLLKSKFRHREHNLIGQLFLNRGPPMDFHSKILVAHAFGVISPPLAEELHSIKSIRNAFAHSKSPLTFEHEIIAREAGTLRMRSAIVAADGGNHTSTMTNRSWFMLAIQLVMIIMQSIEDSPSLADETIAAALAAP
jgi:hypothetical protein